MVGGFMKMYLYLLIIGAITALGYQNCSNKSFSQREDSALGVVGLYSNDITEVVTQIQTNCENARQQNQLRVHNQKIQFEDTKIESGRNEVCLFGQDGNDDIRNTYMQARYEQTQNVNLPAGAVICDLEMTTSVQGFRYDDVFVLTYNNRVLATNNKSALMMSQPEAQLKIASQQNVPIYKYDWPSLRGLPFQNIEDDYCVGENQNLSSCRWPVTERPGSIFFDFDQRLLIALGLQNKPENQKFGFIITGDNDLSLDCYHEKLEFNMNVQYYIP